MINTVELGSTDVIVCRVPIGHMPSARAKEYLREVKASLREHLGQDQKMILLPTKVGEFEMCILKRRM